MIYVGNKAKSVSIIKKNKRYENLYVAFLYYVLIKYIKTPSTDYFEIGLTIWGHQIKCKRSS